MKSTRLTAIVGQQEHLQQTERAACEVQQNIADAPTKRALASEIHPCLKPTAKAANSNIFKPSTFHQRVDKESKGMLKLPQGTLFY